MSASMPRESSENIVPRGAIAFSALLIFIGPVMWSGICFVMLACSYNFTFMLAYLLLCMVIVLKSIGKKLHEGNGPVS
ncbi:hypothetical protein ACQKLP_20680 [Chitinophaga sp. NPDC101104]|uniref:hypothetical protein n=1 Tax=Chitinophaga sp. NPDC101104 TaxID=3390561 RepID=UPI003D00BE3A